MKTIIIMMVVATLAFPMAIFGQSDPAAPPVPDQPQASAPALAPADAPKVEPSQADQLKAMETQIKALQDQLAAAKAQGQPTEATPAGQTPMANAPQAAPAPAPKEQYAPGGVVYVRKATSPDLPPEADYGTFVAKDSAWSLSGLSKEIKYGSDTPAYDLQGFFIAKEAGTYQIAVDQQWDLSIIDYAGFWKPIFTKITLEGNSILAQQDKLAGTKGELRHVGAAKLDPGIYSLRIWTGGMPRDDLGQGTAKWVKALTYKIMIKGPGDMQFRQPHPDEIVHRVAGGK